MATLLALLKALPELLRLANLVMGMVREREQRGLGRAEALSEVLAQAHQEIARADAAAQEARARHAQDSTDGAFDQDFKRGD